MNLAALALVALLCALIWMARRDARDYAAFELAQLSVDRIRFYRNWTVIPLALLGVGGLALLLFLDRIDALWLFPAEFADAIGPIESVSTSASSSTEGLLGMAAGLAVGLSITAIIWRIRLRKMRQPVVGAIEALLPRNKKEMAACIPLALNAGVSEEIFYRLALPLLAFEATGSVAASFAISIAAFGVAHWYQGWKGVMATTAVGALMIWLYLSSGSLLKPILAHILIDMVGLVIRPLVSHHLDTRYEGNKNREHAVSATAADIVEPKA